MNERLIKGNRRIAEARDAAFVAQGLLEGITKHDGNVLDRVVGIDVQIAGGLDTQVDQRVLRQTGQHVIVETDAGADLGAATSVEAELDLDGSGSSQISTGVRFYDHMLASLAKHSLIDLRIQATGDLDVDAHHTVEDVAIVLGDAFKQALGDKRGISRFGDCL